MTLLFTSALVRAGVCRRR